MTVARRAETTPTAIGPAAPPRGWHPCASDAQASRGRLVEEAPSATRTAFQRDRDRILHAESFRRLEYKTQVFVAQEGDRFRTRLTHTLEVAQIARSIARHLGFDDDLAEAVALAHDLGHTPFGHAGEDALNACMAEDGGFDHNEHSLRIVTALERRYPRFDGLNLTWETLEGVVKHNGPLVGPLADPKRRGPRPAEIALDDALDLRLASHPSVEAQIAALADDVAYVNHDIDDGLRVGLFDLNDLAHVPLIGPLVRRACAQHPEAGPQIQAHEAVRDAIGVMVADMIREIEARIERMDLGDCDAVRDAPEPVVAFSSEMSAAVSGLRAFLHERMYRHYQVNRMTAKARAVMRDLFAAFDAEPGTLPNPWRDAAETGERTARRRAVADYLAGLSDVSILEERRRVLDPHHPVGAGWRTP